MALDERPDQQKRDEEYLALALQNFLKRWSPREPRDRADFERETYMLFQRAGAVAQGPVLKRMSAAMALIPFPPIMVKKESI